MYLGVGCEAAGAGIIGPGLTSVLGGSCANGLSNLRPRDLGLLAPMGPHMDPATFTQLRSLSEDRQARADGACPGKDLSAKGEK